MKKLLILLVILLTGCLGSQQAQHVTLTGVIYHHDTAIPIVGADITIRTGNRILSTRTELDGTFAIQIRTKNSSIKLIVEHPEYYPLEGNIRLKPGMQEHIVLELEPKRIERTLMAGIIDYALPELHIAGRGLAAALDSSSALYPVEAELTEILVEPYTYSEAEAAAIAESLGAESYRLYPAPRLIVLTKPAGTAIDEFLAAARNHPLILHADLNLSISTAAQTALTLIPNDPYYDKQWNLAAIYLPHAWQWIHEQPNQRPIRIAVLDSLIDTNHPDLKQNLNLTDAYNAVKQSKTVSDYAGQLNNQEHTLLSHGTHVCGIIAAVTDNHAGVAGTAWGINVEVIPIVVLNEDSGTISDLIAGIYQAVELDVDIINMSFAITDPFFEPDHKHPLTKAVNAAAERGILMAAAAGNYARLLYPAKYPQVVAVGAVAHDYSIPDYSAYPAADQVTIFAPGGTKSEQIFSTDLSTGGSGYAYAHGTSMAAPHAAGAAALIKATDPNITSGEIEQLLWETGIIIDHEQPQKRLINTYAAVTRTPIANAVITFRDLDSASEFSAVPDPNRYFYQFLPSGTYLLTAHIDADQNQKLNSGDWYFEQEITVEAGQHSSDLEILLQIYP